jgi:hypothetical protein
MPLSIANLQSVENYDDVIFCSDLLRNKRFDHLPWVHQTRDRGSFFNAFS